MLLKRADKGTYRRILSALYRKGVLLVLRTSCDDYISNAYIIPSGVTMLISQEFKRGRVQNQGVI